MKNLYVTLLLCILVSQAQAQSYYQYFDGADTNQFSAVTVILDTVANNIWQIGPPQKTVFDSASTAPNALVTDTLNTYPINNQSIATYQVPRQYFYGILAVQWQQKLDMDASVDGGLIEFSIDGGTTWQNAFNNPYVYNFYGYDTLNVDTLPSGEIGFTGTDSTWKNIWFCFDYSYIVQVDSFIGRFRFVSDSVDNGNDGWMIDNMIISPTYIHTVAEKEQEEYLKVFPTVTSGIVNIQAQKLQEFHIIEHIEVYDMAGKLVQKHSNVPTKFFISLDGQPNGQYFVKIKTNKKSETFTIIKQG